MRRFALLTLLLAGCGVAGGPGSPPGPPAVPQSQAVVQPAVREFVPGRILLKSSQPMQKSPVEIRGKQSLAGGELQLLEVAPDTDVLAACKKLRALPGVQYAEPDYILHTAQTAPNDPRFSEQWPLQNVGGADIRALQAWQTTQGSGDVVVAVIDTGLDYDHPDLKANIWNNPGEQPNGLDDDGNGFVDDLHGVSAVPGNSDPKDDNGHGTHCAGIVAAVANNNLGIAGVAPGCKLMALKFLGADGGGPTSRAIACIDYAVAKGARIINASWGGPDGGEALEEAIRRAGDKGVVFVTAAGNFAQDNDLIPNFPASYELPNLISVGASTRTDTIMALSNFGLRTCHLFAPGFQVLSTVPGGGYEIKSGTSMASPHVAGAAALLLSNTPSLSAAAVRSRLLAGARSLPAFQGLCQTGGRLDARSGLDVSATTVYLSSLLPATARPGDSLTLLGQGFGTTPGQVNFVGGSATSSQWTDTQIKLTVPSGASSGPIRVRTSGGIESNPQTFSLYTGVVYSEESVPSTYSSIGSTGTEVSLTDDSSAPVDLPFSFEYHGLPKSKLWISSNGFVTFAEAGSTAPDNRPIPSGIVPNDMIAPFWDDFDPSEGGRILYQTRGQAPNREFIVQWDDLQHYPGTPTGATVQVVLQENGEILFHYPDLTFGDTSFDHALSATIGVENTSGDYGKQHLGEPTTSLRYKAQSGTVSGEQSVALASGWNAVSLDTLKLTEVTPGAGLAGGFTWNASTRLYDAVNPDLAGLNRPIQAGLGMWLFAQNSTQLRYRGQPSGGHFSVDLSPGWNLVSIPGTGSLNPAEILSTSNGVEMPLPAAAASRLLNTWYFYSGSSYGTVDVSSQPLPAGRAYWVFCQVSTRLSR